MKLHAFLSHVFVKRGFLGLVASAWGFMAGGSLLMTALTYKLAIAGFSHYLVLLYQVITLGMLCAAAWVIMDSEYEKKSVATARDFAAIFLLSLCFSAVIPVIFAIGAFVTWRGESRKKPASHAPQIPMNRAALYQRQAGLAGFLQRLMNRWFLKLAH